MDSQNILKIKEIVEPVVDGLGAFLVDVVVRGDRRGAVLELYVDTDAGITIDECAEINRRILPLLESTALLPELSRVEVSSPGVDRPLKFMRQYPRNIGRIVDVKYRAGEIERAMHGYLEDVDDSLIVVKTAEGDRVEVPFDAIIETKVEVTLKH